METNVSSPKQVDVYQIVTDQIIQLLEKGTVPWQKPWKEAGLPMNLLSKRHYRGINLWLLLSVNYEQNLFLTWDQIKKVGGSVNQGEHGHVVIFWKRPEGKETPEQDGKEKKQVPLLRYYKVFNIAQCRDLPKDLLEKHDVLPVTGDVEEDKNDAFFNCETVIHRMPQCPTIVHKVQQALYNRAEDFINMPKKKLFKKAEEYYVTLFHELVHSTGHEKRLNRSFSSDMAETGGEMYSLEELVAEIGASYLASHCEILPVTIDNNTAYIETWLERLKNDKRMIIYASTHAQRAVDYILKIPPSFERKEESEQTKPLNGE